MLGFLAQPLSARSATLLSICDQTEGGGDAKNVRLKACPKNLPADEFRHTQHHPAEVRLESVAICVKTVVL